MTLLIGRYCDVDNDETAPQRLVTVHLDFIDDPEVAQGVIDYVRDVLVDPHFRDQVQADAHALRTMVDEWMRADFGEAWDLAAPETRSERFVKCIKVLDFVKKYPLGVYAR